MNIIIIIIIIIKISTDMVRHLHSLQ